MTSRAVVWFRRDLRLGDNPAWAAASQDADRITALYVLDPILLAATGPFRRHQLLAHLRELDRALQDQGGRLLVRQGDPTDVVPHIAAANGSAAVYANADVTPYARQRDHTVEIKLGTSLQSWWGNLMHPPGSVTTNKGHTSRVFTPFFSKWRDLAQPPWPAPRQVQIENDSGDGLPNCEHESFQAGGEQAATDRLIDFAERVDDYKAAAAGRISPEPPASLQICTSGCWHHGRSRLSSVRPPMGVPHSYANWLGGIGTRICFGRFPPWRAPPCDPSCLKWNGGTIPATLRHGRRD